MASRKVNARTIRQLRRRNHDEEAEVNHDLFGRAIDLGIWTLVVFLLLLFVLSKFAWKPMMQGLEHREARHPFGPARSAAGPRRSGPSPRSTGRTDAEGQRTSAQILDEARCAAERTTAEMIAEAHKKIQAEHERLQREMNLAYDQARRDHANAGGAAGDAGCRQGHSPPAQSRRSSPTGGRGDGRAAPDRQWASTNRVV